MSTEDGTAVSTAFNGIKYEILLPNSVLNWVKASASPVRSITASAADDFADLAPFGAAVGDARIVSLTEDTHGDANAYELMNRQVQYLHQKKGFDVLIIESAMFDTDAVWRSATMKGANLLDLAPGRLFFMYSKVDSARKVLRYVDEQKFSPRPLTLAGFDEPAGGDTSIKELVPALTQFLNARGSALPADPAWGNFASVANQAAALTITDKTNTSTFFAMADRVKAEICPAGKPVSSNLREDPSWWCLQVNGLIAAAQRLPIIAKTQLTPRKDPREVQMAANALWLVTQLYPNKKIIFWANSQHGLRTYQDRCIVEETTCGANEVQVATGSMSMISGQLGKSLYVVKNTPLSGSISVFESDNTWPISNLPENILLSLNKLGINQAFINAPTDQNVLTKLNYVNVLRPDASKMYTQPILGAEMDGLFVYPRAVPAVKLDLPVVPLP
ncbi:erythromycin esterase family protein [Chitinibacter sp. FCG-7]|uniref:Erythromycin esterase family protein n=1 Tax=Chitinibacter mangrovi TaxID=3153927 RepID=A0AAU7FES8_9NEIS